MSDLAKLFSANLAEAMVRGGLTQRELAEASGMAQPAVNRYLMGRTEPGLEAVQKLAAALNCGPWELLKPPGAVATPTRDSLLGALVRRLPSLNEAELHDLTLHLDATEERRILAGQSKKLGGKLG